MREVLFAAFVAIAVFLVVFLVAVMVMQPHCTHAAKNAYWPYSVEMQVRDK
jgi:hypothetical protein